MTTTAQAASTHTTSTSAAAEAAAREHPAFDSCASSSIGAALAAMQQRMGSAEFFSLAGVADEPDVPAEPPHSRRASRTVAPAPAPGRKSAAGAAAPHSLTAEAHPC